MSDIQILEALLNGWHLNKAEQERAKELLHKMNIYIKQQK